MHLVIVKSHHGNQLLPILEFWVAVGCRELFVWYCRFLMSLFPLMKRFDECLARHLLVPEYLCLILCQACSSFSCACVRFSFSCVSFVRGFWKWSPSFLQPLDPSFSSSCSWKENGFSQGCGLGLPGLRFEIVSRSLFHVDLHELIV